MKITVIGASNTIGRVVSKGLSQRYDVIRVGRTRGDYQADITSQKSVEALFAQTGEIDTITSTTGNLHFGPLSAMTDRQFNLGLQDKLLGQIRLALIGQHFLRDGGSTILVSGIVAQEPIVQGANTMTVNIGLEGFVCTAACELPHGIHINLINPAVLSESLATYGDFFPGSANIPAAVVARVYRHSIEGVQADRVYLVGYWPVLARWGRHLYQIIIVDTPTAGCLRPKNRC